MSGSNDIRENVIDYYTNELQSSDDLKTNACCTAIKYPKYIKNALSQIHNDVLSTYYGCGLVVPDSLENMKVMDLGCGTGRDVYLLSNLVGENGEVVGIDMTDKQLDIARKYIDYHKEKYGYENSNVKFIKSCIEDLSDYTINGCYDIIVSNCVINLVKNKEKVFNDVYKLLKYGGEFYFSDVYSSRRIPDELKDNKVLWGECLSGALYWNDFLRLARNAGFKDARLVSSNEITIGNDKLKELVGDIKFYSATYRLFCLPDNKIEEDCEDYNQWVKYMGGIENSENSWKLDDHHIFPKDFDVKVCGNTFNILNNSRFDKYFKFNTDLILEYRGIFPGCGKQIPFDNSSKCC